MTVCFLEHLFAANIMISNYGLPGDQKFTNKKSLSFSSIASISGSVKLRVGQFNTTYLEAP